MTELSEIQKLVDKELEEANKKYPLFHSNHEAYAVIKEEIEECEDDMREMQMVLSYFWVRTKRDKNSDDLIIGIKKSAMHAAAEAIQVAAMCDKFLLKEEQETFLHGWIKCKDPSELTPENICRFCATGPDECGEYPECCYNGVMKELK